MIKLDKKDKFNLFWIIVIYLGIALTITHGKYVFGSLVDWSYQHVAFAQYFRMLFYKTGNIFPNFALNIGGGQNIFYLAYYGLFSPIILLSYLLPFVPMSVYIIITSLVLGIISIVLFYVFIKSFKFERNLCLFLTLMFALATPLLFHSHRHIMFVNYMPFLLMGLMGVNRYFESGKRGLLIISIFFMIMTSYFYSVSGIICITIYAIYVYKDNNFIKDGLKYAFNIVISILMSAFLLFPVIYALKNGRADSLAHVSLLQAIIPKINLEFILYSPYSLGLTSIALVSVFYLCFKKNTRFLGIVLSLIIICPLFVYLLNGALYLDGKALIPFIPLYVLSCGMFLNDLFSSKANLKVIGFIVFFSVLIVYLCDNSLKMFYLLDVTLLVILIILYLKYHRKEIIFIPLMVLFVSISLSFNMSDFLIDNERFSLQNSNSLKECLSDIYSLDDSFYRIGINVAEYTQDVNHVMNINENLITIYSSTYNVSYNKFFHKFTNMASRNSFMTGESKNMFFESLMGVKYLVSDKGAPLGYKKIGRHGNYVIYKNKHVLPIGYATDRIISKKNYSRLKYPDNVYSLLGNVVASDGDYDYESKFSKVNFDLLDGTLYGVKVSKYKNGYKVKVDGDYGNIKIKLDDLSKRYYLLRLNVEKPQSCEYGDTNINVNGIHNKLTCKEWKYFNGNYTFDYTLSSNKGVEYINISFSKGVHYIKDYKMYSLAYEDYKNINVVDKFKNSYVSGDKISGKINVSNNGYFNLSIPYDKGFVIKVDGKRVNYYKVNGTFIGFKITKGKHKIDILYKAPYFELGKWVSLGGLILFLIVIKRNAQS